MKRIKVTLSPRAPFINRIVAYVKCFGCINDLKVYKLVINYH